MQSMFETTRPRRREEFQRAVDMDRRKARSLEGAGRAGWDFEQNAVYGRVYGGDHLSQQHAEGRNAGKGPKGYRRSDENILEDINHMLTEDEYVDASDIEVVVTQGEVILSGKVHDRMTKRRAEDIAERVRGVTHLENRLRVR